MLDRAAASAGVLVPLGFIPTRHSGEEKLEHVIVALAALGNHRAPKLLGKFRARGGDLCSIMHV